MKLKTLLFTALGFLLLGLGILGMVLPLLPTTPFVIAAAACFSGVPRLKAWLMRVPLFNDHIKNYQKRTGLPKKTVVINLITLWGLLILSAVLSGSVWVAALLLVVGTAVTAHICHMAKPKVPVTEQMIEKGDLDEPYQNDARH